MTAERFQFLATAYGADIRRWPDDERAAAAAFAEAHPEAATETLAVELRLDARLDAYEAAPSAALRERIIARAPLARAAARAWRWVTATSLGLGLAAACAAGVAAGFVFAPTSVTRLISPTPASADDASALADPAGDAGTG